jgi:hypothetical protein
VGGFCGFTLPLCDVDGVAFTKESRRPGISNSKPGNLENPGKLGSLEARCCSGGCREPMIDAGGCECLVADGLRIDLVLVQLMELCLRQEHDLG